VTVTALSIYNDYSYHGEYSAQESQLRQADTLVQHSEAIPKCCPQYPYSGIDASELLIPGSREAQQARD
jgi:hypothetical protein